MSSTNFLSLRELRASTTKIEALLNDNGKIIVTSKGKPKALMIQVSENNFEETLAAVNQARFAGAINNIRESAEKNGVSDMTMEEIDAEIAAARRERREKAAREGK